MLSLVTHHRSLLRLNYIMYLKWKVDLKPWVHIWGMVHWVYAQNNCWIEGCIEVPDKPMQKLILLNFKIDSLEIMIILYFVNVVVSYRFWVCEMEARLYRSVNKISAHSNNHWSMKSLDPFLVSDFHMYSRARNWYQVWGWTLWNRHTVWF